MQSVERQLNLLHLNAGPVAKMGTPHKNTVPAGPQEGEEVRTLFVSGLPMDVRLRELYLLFRGYEGYEGSFLKLISSKPGKPPQPIAFVSFKCRVQAERALEELQGIRFDPASSQTLRLEFARTNSRVSPRQPPVTTSSQGAVTSTQQLPIQKSGSDPSYGSYIPVIPNHTQQLSPHLYGPTDTWSQRMPVQMAYQNLSQLSSPSPTLSPASSFPQLSVLNMLDSDNSYPLPSPMYYTLMPSPSPTPTPVSSQHHTSLPPSGLSSSSTSSLSSSSSCSTLFVANLELQHTEEEVADVFRNYAGFVKAKLFTRGGPPVAFVEFKTVECATSAMEKLQGYVLPNTKRVSGIRIEYARQRMGEQFRSPTAASEAVSMAASPSPIQTIYSGQHYQQQQQRPSLHASNGHSSSASSSCSSSTSELQQPQLWALHSSSPVPMPYGNGFGPQPQMLVNGFPNQYVTPWLKYN